MLTLIQNDDKVPAGRYGELLRHWDVPHRDVRLYHGEALPALEDSQAVIVLGGYMGVSESPAYPYLNRLRSFLRDLVAREVPLLGICLGAQLLAAAVGGEVQAGSRAERGVQRIKLTDAGAADPLFAGIADPFVAFQWHNDSLLPPPNAAHLARSEICPGQAFRVGSCAYGVQFHPEVNPVIVADWCRRADLDGATVEAFSRHEEQIRRAADGMLGNFIGLAGFAAPA